MNIHKHFANFFKDENLYPIAYLLSKKLSEGHICIDANEIDKEEIDDSDEMDINVDGAVNSYFVTKEGNERKPFIFFNNKFYIYRYFKYETNIIYKINRIIEMEKQLEANRFQFLYEPSTRELLKELYSGAKAGVNDKTDWQFVGTILSFLHNFTIITGGPGTGKTTTVAKILALLYKENANIKVALTAPTGKAAMRVKEALKANPLPKKLGIGDKVASLQEFTIHRLLGYKPNSPYFKHDEDNHLNYDVVIVDEASMIDVALFYKLISALNPGSRIIILGDKNQLSSVEAGSLFADLCNSQNVLNSMSPNKFKLINDLIENKETCITSEYEQFKKQGDLFEHITELKVSHRFDDNSGIGLLSKNILASDISGSIKLLESNVSNIIYDSCYDTKIFNDFIDKYRSYIEEPDIVKALEKINELRVLCVVREGERGIYQVNRRIEQYLRQKRLIKPNTEFYINRPIIVTKNYRDLGLYNGDIGLIRDDKYGNIKAFFLDDNNDLKPISPGLIAESETVFAMTIHKSQGSEYDNVLVMMPNTKENPLLTRELLYTGITRAKTKIVIQGKKEVIETAILNKVERASGITERVKL